MRFVPLWRGLDLAGLAAGPVADMGFKCGASLRVAFWATGASELDTKIPET